MQTERAARDEQRDIDSDARYAEQAEKEARAKSWNCKHCGVAMDGEEARLNDDGEWEAVCKDCEIAIDGEPCMWCGAHTMSYLKSALGNKLYVCHDCQSAITK